VAWWRNGRALDLRSRGRGFDSRVGVQLRNDCGQVAHTRLPRRRQSSLLYGVVKPGTFTFTFTRHEASLHHNGIFVLSHQLMVPPSQLITHGDQVFTVAGPLTWNSLPDVYMTQHFSVCGVKLSLPVIDWLIWLTDFYWTLLQPKGWIAKYNLYTKIENTINRK